MKPQQLPLSMCNHISTPDKRDLKEWVDKGIRIEDYVPTYHASGFSHPQVPVSTMHKPDVIQPFTWGFIPFWAKPEQAHALMNKTLNARSETMFKTPMYRTAAPGHRCLVFVDGFFEWKHEKVKGKVLKVPHYIYMPDHKPFAFGGLYSNWEDKESGEVMDTFTIITTEANELMAEIHNNKKRMPLILPEDRWGEWLNPDATKKVVNELMTPFPEGLLQAHVTSKLITTRGADTNVPDVQAEVE